MYQYKMKNSKSHIEFGRTMIEMLAILCLIGILGYFGLKGFDRMMDRSKSQAVAKSIKTVVFERQASPNAPLLARQTINGPYGELYIGKGIGDKREYFYVETSTLQFGLCDTLLKTGLIQAEFILINNEENVTCDKESGNVITFYFPYNTGLHPHENSNE